MLVTPMLGCGIRRIDPERLNDINRLAQIYLELT
jgi:hypothetical protein